MSIVHLKKRALVIEFLINIMILKIKQIIQEASIFARFKESGELSSKVKLSRKITVWEIAFKYYVWILIVAMPFFVQYVDYGLTINFKFFVGIEQLAFQFEKLLEFLFGYCNLSEHTIESLRAVDPLYINSVDEHFDNPYAFYIEMYLNQGLEERIIIQLLTLVFSIESVSFYLIGLTIFLIFLSLDISIKHIENNPYLFCLLLLVLELLLIFVFAVTSLTMFYFMFEFVLFPMFLLIGIWGSRERKVLASFEFFITTLFFSLLFFIVFLVLYLFLGDTVFLVSFGYNLVYFPFEIFLWFFVLFSFLVKLPVIPLHFWLPEAHGEASTAGSMILAGVLLKLGSYGIYKFLLSLSLIADDLYLYLLYLLCLGSACISTMVILRQLDMKKLIAYSSISHMAIVAFGLFSMTYDGIDGSIFLMFSHGLVSSSLFMLIGILYDRYKTRMIKNFAGISFFMPVYSFFFMLFIFANMGLPGTSGFVGEFLIFNAMLFVSFLVTFILFIAFFLTGVYTVWHMNRFLYSPYASVFIFSYSDLSLREFFVSFLFALLILFYGIYSFNFFIYLY